MERKRRRKRRTSIILTIVLVLSIFTLFFSASLSYKQFQSVTKSEKLVVHSHEIIQTLEELMSLIKDAETGQRGYFLTQDKDYLKPYMHSINNVDKTILKFKALKLDNAVQKKKFDSLHTYINEKIKLLESNLENGGYTYPLKKSDKIKLKKGNDLMNEIRIKTEEILSFEKIKLEQRKIEHSQEVQISPIIFLYTAIFSLLIFVIAFFKIYADINTLKIANNKLLINEKLFEHSEDISDISNWCWNIESNILTFSNNIYNMLGCEKGDFKQTVVGFTKFVHPEDKHIVIEGAKRALHDLETATSYYRIIRKDGEVRYFKSASKLIKDNFNKDIMIGVISDITEQYNNNRILEEKLFDLERSNKELSAFNHVASHDLQEPLRKIQTFISRIDDIDSISENAKLYFSRIKISANKMQLLIDDLLAFSRANKVENSFTQIDLTTILNDSLQELAQIIEDKKAIINTCELIELNVIPFQIQQLFTNLIGNALKYSKSDTTPVITISCEIMCGKDLIKSSFSNEHKLLKISISDNGIGFEAQYAEDIFTLFNRLHNESEYSGTGIGLTICKKIVENHKGYIIAESTPNVGSQFNVFLPIFNS